VQVNVTAVMTLDQVRDAATWLSRDTAAVISVFAGRIADTGRDPVPFMREAKGLLSAQKKAQLLWASPRELLNIFHADGVGTDIITITDDLLAKIPLLGKSLTEYSLDTVKMFRADALKAGYEIPGPGEGKA